MNNRVCEFCGEKGKLHKIGCPRSLQKPGSRLDWDRGYVRAAKPLGPEVGQSPAYYLGFEIGRKVMERVCQAV